MHESSGHSLRQFWRTHAQPCPYLPEHEERKIITDLRGHDPAALYNELSRSGFRRSHHYAYRPVCAGCQACLPVRIPVAHYRSRRSARRLDQHNGDLNDAFEAPHATLEQYALFRRYLDTRHAESDMADMGFADFRVMIEASAVDTVLLTLRDGADELVGACLTDVLDDGYSAVYSFYRPDDAKRSLGTYLVTRLIARAIKQGLPYVYLGYWIQGSRKMSYKTRFHPLEALGPKGWAPLEEVLQRPG